MLPIIAFDLHFFCRHTPPNFYMARRSTAVACLHRRIRGVYLFIVGFFFVGIRHASIPLQTISYSRFPWLSQEDDADGKNRSATRNNTVRQHWISGTSLRRACIASELYKRPQETAL